MIGRSTIESSDTTGHGSNNSPNVATSHADGVKIIPGGPVTERII